MKTYEVLYCMIQVHSYSPSPTFRGHLRGINYLLSVSVLDLILYDTYRNLSLLSIIRGEES